MGDEVGFLAAIAAAPADDLPRLVFADWLDERGDPWAGLIRDQVAGQVHVPASRNRLVRRVLGENLVRLLYTDKGTGAMVVSGWKGLRWMVRTDTTNVYYRHFNSNEPNYGDPMPRFRVYIERGIATEVRVPCPLTVCHYVPTLLMEEVWKLLDGTAVTRLHIDGLWHSTMALERKEYGWVPT